MAAYTSTQSGNFNDVNTWGGGGYPNLDGDTFTVAAGHVVTYNLTTPLHGGLGSSVVNSGGTFIMDTNTVIRFNGATFYHFACSGNLIIRPGAKTLLKGLSTAERAYDIRPLSFTPTTATGVSGASTISVGSTSQLYVGNRVSGTGIAATAYVTSIGTGVVTLSAPNTGTVSGNLTAGNYVEIIGNEGMPATTVSTAVTVGNYQQGYISAASTVNFAVNDWIAVYERGIVDARIDRNDEGFIIHDIEGSNLYIREFVGPTATISAVDTITNKITVSNAKVFRTWQKLIFGTGTSRNISSITSIDPNNNIISLGSTINGSVSIGTTVYTTGPLQTKNVNDRIRKCATTVTVQAASTATQISVASTAGLSVGDEIIVDARWDTTATSFIDEYPEKRNITAISGNTLTLNQSLGYIVFVGSFVVRTSRDIKFVSDYEVTLTLSAAQSFAQGDVLTQAYSGARGVVKTATVSSTSVTIQDVFGQFISGTTNSPWISNNGTPLSGNVYVTVAPTVSTTEGHSGFGFARNAAFLTNQLPVLYFRDVEVATFSNATTTSSRLFVRGYWSTLTNSIGGVEIEGISYCKPNQADTFSYQDNAIFISRYFHDLTVRCCVAWNTQYGIRFNEGYDLRNGAMFNNYSGRSEVMLLCWEQMDNSGTLGGAAECAYNYLHRGDDVGFYILGVRCPGRGIHHNWVNVTQARALQFDITYSQTNLYQNRFQHFFEWVWPTATNNFNVIYNEWIPPSTNLYDFSVDSNFQRHNQSVTFGASTISLEHNYNYDQVCVFIPGGKRDWDSTESAWRCVFDDDLGAIDTGLSEVYYIPANIVLTAYATIRLDPAFNGTAPKLEIRSFADRFFAGSGTLHGANNPFVGYSTSVNFNAGNITTYQTVSLSIPSTTWGRSVTVGVVNVNSNASEGWWEKPIEIKYSSLPSVPFVHTGINKFSGAISSFSSGKIRFGGGTII